MFGFPSVSTTGQYTSMLRGWAVGVAPPDAAQACAVHVFDWHAEALAQNCVAPTDACATQSPCVPERLHIGLSDVQFPPTALGAPGHASPVPDVAVAVLHQGNASQIPGV